MPGMNMVRQLEDIAAPKAKAPVIGIFATSDPRIDKESRLRCQNIARLTAERIGGAVQSIIGRSRRLGARAGPKCRDRAQAKGNRAAMLNPASTA